MKCSDVMTRNPSYCVPTDRLQHVAQLMKTHDVGAIPVVDDASRLKLLGIVTDRDLAVKVVAEGKSPTDVQVDDIMTRDPVCCLPEDDVTEVRERMEVYQVRRVPVVDHDKRLQGIIAQADLATRTPDTRAAGETVRHISENREEPGH